MSRIPVSLGYSLVLIASAGAGWFFLPEPSAPRGAASMDRNSGKTAQGSTKQDTTELLDLLKELESLQSQNGEPTAEQDWLALPIHQRQRLQQLLASKPLPAYTETSANALLLPCLAEWFQSNAPQAWAFLERAVRHPDGHLHLNQLLPALCGWWPVEMQRLFPSIPKTKAWNALRRTSLLAMAKADLPTAEAYCRRVGDAESRLLLHLFRFHKEPRATLAALMAEAPSALRNELVTESFGQWCALDAHAAVEWIVEEKRVPTRRDSLEQALVSLAQTDAKAAFAIASNLPVKHRQSIADAVVFHFATQAPEPCLRWLLGEPGYKLYQTSILSLFSQHDMLVMPPNLLEQMAKHPDTTEDLRSIVLEKLGSASPETALSIAMELPENLSEMAVQATLEAYFSGKSPDEEKISLFLGLDPTKQLQALEKVGEWARDTLKIEQLASLWEGVEDPRQKRKLQAGLLDKFLDGHPKEAAEYLLKTGEASKFPQIMEEAVNDLAYGDWSTALQLARQAPTGQKVALEIIALQHVGYSYLTEMPKGLLESLTNLAKQENTLPEMLRTNKSSSIASLSEAGVILGEAYGNLDPAAAVKWQESLPQSETRRGLAHGLIKGWRKLAPEAALEWAKSRTNPAERKTALNAWLADATEAETAANAEK